MFPIINIGPFAIQAPGLFVLSGIWGGLFLADRYLDRHKIEPKKFNNLVLISLISGLIGARLFFVIQYLEIFLKNPLSILSINPNLFDMFGGIICASLAGIIFGNKNGFKLWFTLDAITPILAVLSISIGLAHLASGSHFGIPTNLPFGIELWGQIRHPVQVYHLLAAMMILVFLWPGRRFIAGLPPGVYFLLFISISSAAYLLISAFQARSHIIFYGFRSEQLIAWMILAICLFGIKKLGNRSADNFNNKQSL